MAALFVLRDLGQCDVDIFALLLQQCPVFAEHTQECLQLPLGFLVMLLLAELCSAPALAQTPLTNGAQTTATLAVNTTNFYTFTATNGDGINLRVGAPFRPLLALYAPNGALLDSAAGSANTSLDGWVQVTLATNGTFKVAMSSYYGNGTGAYLLNLAKAPGEFVVSPGDEGAR